jgi:hypothetical protein
MLAQSCREAGKRFGFTASDCLGSPESDMAREFAFGRLRCEFHSAGLNRAVQAGQLLLLVQYCYPNHAWKTALGKEANPFGSDSHGQEIETNVL